MEKEYDVIIVGSGIAGMTCAIFLKRYNMNVLILEKNYPGGQLNTIGKIENYPGFLSIDGPDLAENIHKQLNNLDVKLEIAEVISIEDGDLKTIKTNNGEYKAKYVVLATGRAPKKLGLENESKLLGHGISYCATCDGPLYKDKRVMVVGGGDSALQEALYLSNICKEVVLVHRRDSFRGVELLANKVKNKENVEILYNSTVVSLNGEDTLAKVQIKQNDNIIDRDIDGLFIFIGMEPQIDCFSKTPLKMVENYIEVDENGLTSIPGVYACGDIIYKNNYLLTTAAGDATNVASHIHIDYLKNKKRD